MSDNTLDQALADLLTEAAESYDAAKGFLSEEVPQVAEEVILWGIWANGIGALLCLAGLALIAWANTVLWRNTADQYDPELPRLLGGFAAVILGVPLLVGLFDWTLAALKALIAPRLYLIEYAAGLLS